MSCNAKKDPNGTWRIQYRWMDWAGTKKKSQKRGFKTKKEAEEWYAHFMLQQSSDPTMTLADFWEIYKADMEKRLRKTTMKQKEYVMNDKILPYFGKTPINEITAPMIRKWQGEMMEKGFKPTYLKTIHNQLSAILNYAVNFYDLRSNPCRKAGSMGKSKADERPYWTLEEFQKFSDAIMDKQDSWIAFQILFWTGMRIGELLALQVKDIDFEQGTITVDESLTRLDGEDLITAPKMESSVRVITIHKELQEELKEYIATLYHVRPGTRLFAGRTKEMKRGIKMSGVKKITVHCTRHSHASRSEIDEMKDRDILGFSMVENKDSFLLAVAMGVDSPEAVKSKDGWFLMKNLKTTDKALLAAVLLGTANDDSDVDAFADIEKALDLCEQCAESGFKDLRKRIIDAGKDREILERRMMKELDLLYTTNVEADI
jgi:integrase